MKGLKEIVDGIAQALNMTVDSLVKVYPQLRVEYSWYYVYDNLQIISIIAILVLLALSGAILAPVLMLNDSDDNEYIRASKVLKWALAIVGVLALVLLVSTVLKGFMCPDILIIKDFLNRS